MDLQSDDGDDDDFAPASSDSEYSSDEEMEMMDAEECAAPAPRITCTTAAA